MIGTILEHLKFAQFCILHRRSLLTQQQWQEKYLRRIVRYAFENVPLWRSLLKEMKISPSSIYFLEDVLKLPVTSKETFIGKMVEEYIDNSRGVSTSWYITSGTSGIPFRFLMSDHAVLVKYTDFASLRFLWWRGESFKKVSSVKIARIKIRGLSKANRLFIPVNEYLRDPRQVLARIVNFKAEIISTYPSILLDIARLIVKDSSFPKPKPQFILSFGETLFPSVRSFVSNTLECEIYDRYGLEEIGAVGVECAMHNGFHINTESVIVEITDEAYNPVLPGIEGKIITTDLFNYSMPFIRYDTGDRGIISNEPCSCGLRSPRLWIKGRYSSYLSFSARRVHHLEFDGAMDEFMNFIFQYQISKKSNNEILARIIPGPAFHSGISERVKTNLRRLVGDGPQISVQIVERLHITPRGKSRIVIDESMS